MEVPGLFCAPSLLPLCIAAYSLLDSSLFPVLLASSLLPLLALHGSAPAGQVPCMFRHGCPPSVPPPIPGSRPWHPAAAQPTLFWTLRSFRCCLLLSSAPPRSPRVCPGRVGPPVCPAMGTLLLLFPDSRFPSVVPGCAAAYSLLGSSLLPALSAYSLKPLLALPGCAPAGRAPCMPPAFSRFQAPGRDTRPRPVPASLSSPLRARTSVSSFFRGSVRKMLYI